MADKNLLTLLGLALLAVALESCGGGGGGTPTPPSTGRLQVQVSWPDQTRYVPPYANSLVCTLDAGLSTQATLTLNRSGTAAYVGAATFSSAIQAGPHTLNVVAYTQTAGQGQTVATATLAPTITAGQTDTVDVTANLTSTISNVVIDGQPITVPQGGAVQLEGHAVDANNDAMLLPSGALTWSITAGGTLATVTSAGLLTAGNATGQVTVQLAETGAAKQNTANVAITLADPVDHVVIDNQPLAVEAGSTLQLQGHAVDAGGNTVGLPNGDLTWTVTSGASYGSVTSAGLFTGSAAGTAQVTLKEASSGKTANANVVVTAQPILYVADYYNNRLTKMTGIGGTNWAALGVTAGTPACIAFDSQGRIYWTTDQGNTVCRADDFAGDNLVSFGSLGAGTDQFNSPFGIAIDNSNRIYVADSGNNRIVRVDDMSGTNWTTFGTVGSGTDQFTSPQGVAIGPSGDIYVSDTMNFRIVRVNDMSGTGWVSLGGTAGSGNDQFDGPIGLFVDSSEHIWVADSANDRIVRFTDMSGTGWTAFGATGSGTGQFNRPSGVCTDYKGRIYIADTFNNRIVRISDMSGTGWASVGPVAGGTGTDQFSDPSWVIAK